MGKEGPQAGPDGASPPGHLSGTNGHRSCAWSIPGDIEGQGSLWVVFAG